MSDPHRWRTGGAPAEEIDRMLAAGRATRGMPPAVRARAVRRLGAAAPAAAAMLLVWKGFAIAAGVCALGAAGVAITRDLRAPSRDVRVADAPALAPPVRAAPKAKERAVLSPERWVPAPASTPSAGPLAVPSAARAAPQAPAPERAIAAPKAEDTLSRELALLEDARARFDSDPAATLAILDEHARAFPSGKLAIERELLAIDALDRLGQTATARARAERLLERARGTIYEARVRRRSGS